MEIESQRLILRDYKESDWERVHIYGSDSDFSKYEPWGPNSIEDTKNFITDMIKQANNKSRYKFEFAIIEKSSNLLIGGCGLRRKCVKSNVADFGYAVGPEFQSKGYATEATQQLIKFGFEDLKLSVIVAICDVRNVASYRVMEKCNMQKVGLFENAREFKGEVRSHYCYEITKDEYIERT